MWSGAWGHAGSGGVDGTGEVGGELGSGEPQGEASIMMSSRHASLWLSKNTGSDPGMLEPQIVHWKTGGSVPVMAKKGGGVGEGDKERKRSGPGLGSTSPDKARRQGCPCGPCLGIDQVAEEKSSFGNDWWGGGKAASSIVWRVDNWAKAGRLPGAQEVGVASRAEEQKP